jgi:hypothetical protein
LLIFRVNSQASLVLSIPSAALAVTDLADRIRKRRRATELIDHAQQVAAGSKSSQCSRAPGNRLVAAVTYAWMKASYVS